MDKIFEPDKLAFEGFRHQAVRIMRPYGFDILAMMWEAKTDRHTEFVYLSAWPPDKMASLRLT